MQKTEKHDPCGNWIDPGLPLHEKDPLAIDVIDYVEIYSANAKQAAYYYCHAFGFKLTAYRGPETGHAETASYVLEQDKIRLLLTTPLRITSPLSALIALHGDSVRSVALRVQSCEEFYYQAMRNGAESAEAPCQWQDSSGSVKRAAIKTYGDTIHQIVERKDYKGIFWPGFVNYLEIFPDYVSTQPVGLRAIDHIVGNVELGKMNHWVSFYEKVLGFTQMTHFTDKDISTEYSALMSKVMRNGTGKIKFPINEPAQGRRKSQIEEYLEFHNGPGVQHIALITGDIISAVAELKKRGIGFLRVPQNYYDELPKRIGKINEDFKKIAELGILVDRDEDGYLLQIFTKPVQDRPTLFFEIIERHGSQGFGVGNFKALFEAIEREQALRGNL